MAWRIFANVPFGGGGTDEAEADPEEEEEEEEGEARADAGGSVDEGGGRIGEDLAAPGEGGREETREWFTVSMFASAARTPSPALPAL